MTENKSIKARKRSLYLTVAGMLIALEIIMAFTPLGYLKLGLLSITFLTIPVIIGAVTNGVKMGAVLGLTFGLTSFAQCFGMDAFGTALMGINPWATFITCVCTRTLMGCLCGLLYKWLSGMKMPAGAQVGIAAFSAPFLNTVFFMACLLLFFWRSDYVQSIADGAPVLTFLVTVVGVNGIVEWAVCTAVGTAVSLALQRAMKTRKGKQY